MSKIFKAEVIDRLNAYGERMYHYKMHNRNCANDVGMGLFGLHGNKHLESIETFFSFRCLQQYIEC